MISFIGPVAPDAVKLEIGARIANQAGQLVAISRQTVTVFA